MATNTVATFIRIRIRGERAVWESDAPLYCLNPQVGWVPADRALARRMPRHATWIYGVER